MKIPFKGRLALLLLSAVLVTSILGACSREPNPNPEETPRAVSTRTATVGPRRPAATATIAATRTESPPASAIDVDPADLDGVTVEFWHVWSWKEGDTLLDLVTEFNVTNEYGIRVEAVNQGGYSDLSRRLTEAINNDNLPDLVVGFNNQILAWDQAAGVIVDLEAYLADPEWGYSAVELADFFPLLLDQDLVGGKRVGLPAQRSARFLFYNQTWAQELGFDEQPATPETFQEQVCAAAAANLADQDLGNDGTGGWVIDTSTATMLSWISAFGGDISTASGYAFAGEGTAAAFRYLKTLFDEGCAWLSKNRFPDPDFANRRALITASSTAGLPFQEEALLEADNPDDWTVIPFPAENGDPAITLSGPSFAVIESSQETQLAVWLLVKWLLEPDNQARWVRVSGHWPSRASALEHLEDYRASHPQWGAHENLLSYAHGEPARASWGTVRWSLSDAAEQLFRLNLSLDQIPPLLEELDETAAELDAQAR